MTAMNVEIMFPVSIALFDLDPALQATTRTKVMDYLASERAKRDVAASPVDSVETSYFTDRSVLDDAKLHELRREVIACGEQFVAWFGVPGYQLEVERSWINVFKPGMQETEHSHEGSVLSGVYYVETSENCGDLMFQDPIGARRAHRAFTQTNAITKQAATQIGYAPRAGRLLFFESWLPHAVSGNKSNETRISIAINLRRKR
jgi:uncharacterized protein (TIGR02466 family)